MSNTSDRRLVVQTAVILLFGAVIAVGLSGGAAATPANDTTLPSSANDSTDNRTYKDYTPVLKERYENVTGPQTDLADDISRAHGGTAAVGDEEEFSVAPIGNNPGYYTVNATVAAETDNAVIYVQDGVANNSDISAADVDRIAAAFENDIHPELVSNGANWNDINGDGRLTILVYDIPRPVAGYFNPNDYTNSPNSNQRDMIYMGQRLGLGSGNQFNETMTQETQHIINFNLARNKTGQSETWLDEAVANYMEYEVYGTNKPNAVDAYERAPQYTSLSTWRQTFPDYGASFLFAMYLSEHYGDIDGQDGFMIDMMRQSSRGEEAVTDTLSQYGYSKTFDEVYLDWTVANGIDDDSVADEYGYNTLDPSMQTTSVSDTSSADSTTDVLAGTGAKYVEVSPNSESFYYDINVSRLDPIAIERTGSDTEIRWGTNTTTDTNRTTIRAASNGTANISRASRRQSLLSTPPIGPNNTFTDASEYDSVQLVIPNTGGAVAFNLTTDRVPSDNRFTGTLAKNETASYVIPVNEYGVPSVGSIHEYNGDVFASVWSLGSSDTTARLETASGAQATELSTPAGIDADELLGSNRPSENKVWRLDVESDTANEQFRVATTYAEGALDADQVYTLPSEVEINAGGRDLQAGSNSTPKPIEFTVDASTAGKEYTHQPFGEPAPDHFNVTIGNKTVDNSNITVASSSGGEYKLIVVAPKQPSNGQYDLNVTFADEKFGVEGNATTRLADGVSYSGGNSIALVMDRSGSMGRESPSRISRAKDAGNQFLDRLGGEDSVALVSYADVATTEVPLQRFGGNASAFRSGVSGLSDSGGTNIYAGLYDAGTELDTAPNETTKAVILLSDGLPTEGPGESEIVRLSADLGSRGYCVYTVAFGSGADDALMQDIASQNCGGFEDTTGSGTDIGDIYRDLSSTTSGQSAISKSQGSVGSSNSVTKSFDIDETTGDSVVSVAVDNSTSPSADTTGLSAVGSADVDENDTAVLLYYPNGTQVQRNNSTESGTENPDIEFTTSGDTQTYRIDDPRPGEWSYEIVNEKNSSVEYQADVSGSTGTTMTVLTDSKTYVKGSDAELSTVLAGPDGGLNGAAANATVEAPNGSTQQVTLPETGNGQYSATIPLEQSGEYTATIEMEVGNISREKSVSWTAVNNSSLLNVTGVDNATVAKDGEAELSLNLTRPSTAPSPAVTHSRFDNAVREYATMSPEEIRAANVSESVRQAALQAQGGANVTANSGSNVAAASGSSVNVYVQTSSLTGQNGTIPEANVRPERRATSLGLGESRDLSLSVAVPQSTPAGEYSGQVTLLVDGTKIEQEIAVTVTSAGETTYRLRIVNATEQWQEASPGVKPYFTDRIADSVTNIYFDTESGANLTSGATHWQGQELTIAAGNGAAGETYRLREVTESGGTAQPGPLARELELDGTGSASFTTNRLEGSYAIVDETGTPVQFDQRGTASGTASLDAASFEITTQSLSVAFNESEVDQGNTTAVTLNSVRTDYTVTVQQDELSVSQLAAVFNRSDADRSRPGYQLEITSAAATLETNTTGVTTGTYTFEFAVTDTGTVGSASITVESPTSSDRAEVGA